MTEFAVYELLQEIDRLKRTIVVYHDLLIEWMPFSLICQTCEEGQGIGDDREEIAKQWQCLRFCGEEATYYTWMGFCPTCWKAMSEDEKKMNLELCDVD